MSTDARLRISLSTGEFEIEGPEAFVAQYDEVARRLLTRLNESSSDTFKHPPSGHDAATTQPDAASNGSGSWPEFGEAIHKLPRNATGTDLVLVAGHYASMTHADQTFATSEASKLLIEQSIKVTNPSQSLKNNLTAKRVFKVGSRYKISREGTERINQLLHRS
jgi:hypothetical protein